MIHKTATVIVFTLFLSACCEKEGSFLNTIIKNHTAKIAAAAAQQQAITNHDSSTLNANAAAIPDEDTLQLSLKPNKENTSINETGNKDLAIEKIATEADLQHQDTSNKKTIKQIDTVKDPVTSELNVKESLEGKSKQKTITKLKNTDIDSDIEVRSKNDHPKEREITKTEFITNTDPQETTTETEQIPEDKLNDSTKIITAAIDQDIPSIQLDEVIEKIADKTVSLNKKQNDDESRQVSVENAEQSLGNVLYETKKSNDYKKERLSELISLLNEEDNTAIGNIIEKAKADDSIANDASKYDRNKRLLELLSKDIRQQSEKTNSKISRQSRELLNEILSD